MDDATLAPLKGRVPVVDLAEVAQVRDVGHRDVDTHAGAQLRLNFLLCVATPWHVIGLQLLRQQGHGQGGRHLQLDRAIPCHRARVADSQLVVRLFHGCLLGRNWG